MKFFYQAQWYNYELVKPVLSAAKPSQFQRNRFIQKSLKDINRIPMPTCTSTRVLMVNFKELNIFLQTPHVVSRLISTDWSWLVQGAVMKPNGIRISFKCLSKSTLHVLYCVRCLFDRNDACFIEYLAFDTDQTMITVFGSSCLKTVAILLGFMPAFDKRFTTLSCSSVGWRRTKWEVNPTISWLWLEFRTMEDHLPVSLFAHP